MTATAARIGFIQNQFRRVISEDAEVRVRHGDLARESEDPVETFFDDPAHAQIMADERQALLSSERRRFQVSVNGLSEALAIDYLAGTIPLATFIDTERAADMTAMLAEITLDFAGQAAEFVIGG